MDTKKRFALLLSPVEESKKTDISICEVSPSVKLDEMYKLIDCRCIDICYPSCITTSKQVLNYSPILIYDDEFLLVNEPKVNYAASILANSVICGNVLLLQDYEDDDGERNSRGFLPQEAVKLKLYVDTFNTMTDNLCDITPPKPFMEFKSFDNNEDFINYLESIGK